MMQNFLKSRQAAFGHAFRGIALLFRSSVHARIHALAFAAVVFAGIFFKINNTEWLTIFLVSGLVLAAESLNSALEEALDVLHPQQNSKIGRSKDLAAGAVLLSAIFATLTGVWIFIPKILELIGY